MFHRLADATYFGGPLLAGFDKLNDPTGGGSGTGIATPSDTGAKSGGTYDGVYFVAAGETANSFNVNRGMRALAENTDFLDDLMRRDIAVTVRDSVSAGHGGSSTHDLDGSTDNIYVGSSALGAPPLIELFSVTDPNDEAPIFVSGQKVVVTSISPDNRGVGAGFDNTNPVTLTFNQTIPDAQAFQVYYGIRRNLATLPENVFTFMDILRATESGASAAGVAIDDTNLTAVALSDIDTKSGGAGNPISTSQEAFDNIDTRLTGLRGFVATISDGTNSFGGSFENTSLNGIVNSGASTIDGGIFSIRAGVYDLSADWDLAAQIIAASDGATTLRVASGAAANVDIAPGARVEGVNLDSAAAAYVFEVTGSFIADGRHKENTFGTGCILINHADVESVTEIRGYRTIANTAITTGAVAALEITGKGKVVISDCYFEDVPENAVVKTAVLYIHSILDDSQAFILVENCDFVAGSDSAGAEVCYLSGVRSRVIFRNCSFSANDGSADSYAVRLDNCRGVVFENCYMFGHEGQVIRAENSGVVFRDCVMATGTGSALSDPQAVTGYGITLAGDDREPFTIQNCSLDLGLVSFDASGTPTRAVVELGGIGNTRATNGTVLVDGLLIEQSSAGVHNYTTVLLHGYGGDDGRRNIYKNIVYDADSGVPTGTGTLGSFGGAGTGMLIEVVGDLGSPKTVVENLSITNVKDPTVSHARGIAFFKNCEIRTFSLEGSSVAGAGVYQEQLLVFESCDVHNIQWFIDHLIRTDDAQGICDCDGVCRFFGGRIRLHTYTGFFRVFTMEPLNLLQGIFVYGESTTGIAAAWVFSNPNCVISNCTFLSEQTSGNPILDPGDQCTVNGNIVFWKQGAGTIATFAADSAVLGNIFGSTNATAPTVTYPSGSGVGDDTMNVRAGSLTTPGTPAL